MLCHMKYDSYGLFCQEVISLNCSENGSLSFSLNINFLPHIQTEAFLQFAVEMFTYRKWSVTDNEFRRVCTVTL